MNAKNLVPGYVSKFFGLNKNYKKERLLICKKCPLFFNKNGTYICNSSLYMNPNNGDVSIEEKEGYKRGCGCVLDYKTGIINEKCPLGKW
jgi:hypothetical protein